ncbi:MAG: hypothetical protein PHQ27_09440, partial [Victivallales bacterium]|nr:hypothetical protein [Victivallales bacterium]
MPSLTCRRKITGIAVLAFLLLLSSPPGTAADNIIKNWQVLGDFPNPDKAVPAGICPRVGFDRDYLASIGGETKAKLTAATVLKFRDEAGKEREIRSCSAVADADGIVDFKRLFPASDRKVAYAAAVITAPQEREMNVRFGANESAKVWCNGQLVYKLEERQEDDIRLGENYFTVKLRPGANHLLVKVENDTGPWGFAWQEIDRAALEYDRFLLDLRDCRLFPAYGQSYVFNSAQFPVIAWNATARVKQELGLDAPPVRWFGPDLQPATAPARPGRYIAYAEIKGRNGLVWRRALTCCKIPPEMQPWNLYREIDLPAPNNHCFSPEVWKDHRTVLHRAAAGVLASGLYQSEDGAALLAYAMEMKETDRPDSTLDNPWIANNDANLALKRRLLGITPDRFKKLRPPEKISPPAPVLRPGTAEQAGMKPDTPEKLRQICADWARDGGTPLVALVARNGVVFFHEAFGDVSREQKFEA